MPTEETYIDKPALPEQTLRYQLSLNLRRAFQQFIHLGIPEQALNLIALLMP